MNDNFSQILQSINSSEDVDTILGEIDALIEGIYEKGDKSFENVLNEKVRIRVANELKNAISASGMTSGEYLKRLKAEVEKLQTIKLTLAFEPSQAAITRIARWVKENISNYTIVEHLYDKDIVGGVVIEYQGNYHDYSLRKNFSQMITEKKVEILKLIEQKEQANE